MNKTKHQADNIEARPGRQEDSAGRRPLRSEHSRIQRAEADDSPPPRPQLR